MTLLCDTCVHSHDDMPNLASEACMKATMKRAADDSLISCSSYEKSPLKIHLNVDNGTVSVGTLYHSTEGVLKHETKPPIGTKPYYIVAGGRIHELVGAIDRYAGSPNRNLEAMRSWAREIIAQCDLIEKMEEKEETNG